MATETINKNLGKVEKMLAIMDGDTLTRSEFVSSFSKVVDLVLKIQKQQGDAIKQLEQTYENLMKKVEDTYSSSLSDIKGQVDHLFVDKQMKKMRDEHEQMVSKIEEKMNSIKDGYTPIKGKDFFDGKNGRDGYNVVVDENIIKDISYLMDEDKKIKSTNKKGEPPARFLGGVLSTGVRFEAPNGTIDGVNTSFTFFKTPLYVIVDGVTYFEDNGYTISGKTLTTSVPPTGFIRSAF